MWLTTLTLVIFVQSDTLLWVITLLQLALYLTMSSEFRAVMIASLSPSNVDMLVFLSKNL